MKYQAASLKTKRALAESLKKLMRAKPFSKITVTEIVNKHLHQYRGNKADPYI